MPKAQPVRIETTAVKTSTRQFRRTSVSRGVSGGRTSFNTASDCHANSSPTPPPTNASMMFSVRSCRAIRRGEAPIAVRIPISRWRAAALDRLRFATFAQAVRSTSAAAAIRMRRRALTLPTSASRSGMTVTFWFQSAGIFHGKRVADPRLEESDLGVGVSHRGTGPETADERHEIAGPVASCIARIEAERHPDLRASRGELEPLRHDGDDLATNAVELDEAADDARV